MKVVLVGPISGMPNFNDEEFARVKAKLEAFGHEVWSPHERSPLQVEHAKALAADGDIGGGAAHHFWMRISMAKIASWAEAICILDGWENSRGALSEIALAFQIGVEVGDEEGRPLVEFHYEFKWRRPE